MECLRVIGGKRLTGTVATSGAKNAALPIMAASILAGGPVRLHRVPRLKDVDTLALLLGHLGVEVKRGRDAALNIQTVDSAPTVADRELVARMRASFCVLGPLLARRGCARVALPGGCSIGARPVDLHLAGLAALGAEIRIERGYVLAQARRLRGAEVSLLGPHGPTVTGTANVLCAAVLARGKTVLRDAAIEPEIVDLGRFLNALGARISGLGTTTLEIDGVDELGGTEFEIIGDRIEAGTLLLAGAITGGSVTVTGVCPEHLAEVMLELEECGCVVTRQADGSQVQAGDTLRALQLVVRPFPGLPTDLQAQFMALLTKANGASTVCDTIFPERFAHVAELCRLGARIVRRGNRAIIAGVTSLSGAMVTACDLRASAALVLAGLAAEGETLILQAHHLDRGYDDLPAKLVSLGAQIVRETDQPQRSGAVRITN